MPLEAQKRGFPSRCQASFEVIDSCSSYSTIVNFEASLKGNSLLKFQINSKVGINNKKYHASPSLTRYIVTTEVIKTLLYLV